MRHGKEPFSSPCFVACDGKQSPKHLCQSDRARAVLGEDRGGGSDNEPLSGRAGGTAAFAL